MIELFLISLAMIVSGLLIYNFKYRKKEKLKMGLSGKVFPSI